VLVREYISEAQVSCIQVRITLIFTPFRAAYNRINTIINYAYSYQSERDAHFQFYCKVSLRVVQTFRKF